MPQGAVPEDKASPDKATQDKAPPSKVQALLDRYAVGPGLGLIVMGMAYLVFWLMPFTIDTYLEDNRWAHNWAFSVIIFTVGAAWYQKSPLSRAIAVIQSIMLPITASGSFNTLYCSFVTVAIAVVWAIVVGIERMRKKPFFRGSGGVGKTSLLGEFVRLGRHAGVSNLSGWAQWPGERATLFRFWMAGDTYQTVSSLQSLIFIHVVRHYLTTAGLGFTFFPCAQPDFWAPVFMYADLARIPEADFEVGGRCYGVYGHDWRVMPPADWLALLAEREVAGEVQPTPPPRAAEPLIVLSQSGFMEAVRDALRHFGYPEALRQNPLLRSRLVIERAGSQSGGAARVAALQDLVRETAESLQATPRQLKSYRAL